MPHGQHPARGRTGGALRRLDDPEEAARRRALLVRPHMAALEWWRAGLAVDRPVPHMDPLDGGARAQLLILLETPSAGLTPLTFVSQDNATPTARNLRRFLGEAGLTRDRLLLWNVVPWVVHAPGARNRPVRAAEVRDSLATLPHLLDHLPDLRAVVLAGRPARSAEPVLAAARPGLPVFTMPHPSPTIVCTSPLIAERIGHALARAAALVGDRTAPG